MGACVSKKKDSNTTKKGHKVERLKEDLSKE